MASPVPLTAFSGMSFPAESNNVRDREFLMFTRRVLVTFLFFLAFVFSATSAFAQQTVILDFSTGNAGFGGTITVSGGQATGAGIPVDFLSVSAAHGAPLDGL